MSQSQEFTYVGPSDEVEVVVRVRRGEKITVPAGAAGRPPRQEFDEQGVLTLNDPGEGLLAQPHAWEPVLPKFAVGGIATEPTEATIGGDGPEAIVPMGDLTVADLRQRAESAGIDLGGATRKADIIAAIEAADTPQED